MRKAAWVVLLLTLLAYSSPPLAGNLIEPVLERKLSRLFGLPVTLEGLRVNFLSGRVRVDSLEFFNPHFFSPKPHLKTAGLDFDIDFPALLRREVRIGVIDAKELFYFLERVQVPGPEKMTNVRAWVRHIKNHRASPLEADDHKKPWQVFIDKIRLENSTFIYHDRSDKERGNRVVFQRINGSLKGFRWPSEDPERLEQSLSLRGEWGEEYPFGLEISGGSNFAGSEISFDLKGKVPEGNVLEIRDWWAGLPLKIEGGDFRLWCHVRCVRMHLEASNRLVFEHLQIRPGDSAVDKIWGLPLAGVITFLQDEKAVRLMIRVTGDIRDPQFNIRESFIRAFQNSLKNRTKKGVYFFGKKTTDLARQGVDLVEKTQEVLVRELKKIPILGHAAVPDPRPSEERD